MTEPEKAEEAPEATADETATLEPEADEEVVESPIPGVKTP